MIRDFNNIVSKTDIGAISPIQVDKDIFRSNSGIVRTSTRLAGNPLFGCVKLVKTERSETASLADLLD